MSHGGSGGGHGGHGGTGHQGGYGHAQPGHHFSHDQNPFNHGVYADAPVQHGGPGHSAQGHGNSGHAVAGVAHTINGVYGQIAGIFLSSLAHAFGIGHQGGHHGQNGHAPAGAPPGTHHVSDWPATALAQRESSVLALPAKPTPDQPQKASKPIPQRPSTGLLPPKIAMFAYPAVLMGALMLWLCVVSSTRQAELVRKKTDAAFATVKYGQQMKGYDAGVASSAGTTQSNEAYNGQGTTFAPNGEARYKSAFGCARPDGYSETEPTASNAASVEAQTRIQQGPATSSITGAYQGNRVGLAVLNRAALGELANPGNVASATGYSVYQAGIGGIPAGRYGQNLGAASNYCPPPPNSAYSSPGPLLPPETGSLAGGLDPHRLAPHMVMAGR